MARRGLFVMIALWRARGSLLRTIGSLIKGCQGR